MILLTFAYNERSRSNAKSPAHKKISVSPPRVIVTFHRLNARWWMYSMWEYRIASAPSEPIVLYIDATDVSRNCMVIRRRAIISDSLIERSTVLLRLPLYILLPTEQLSNYQRCTDSSLTNE